MVQTRPSKTAAELSAILDATEDDEVFDSSAAGLSQQSALKMLDQSGVRYRVLSARFTGNLPAIHAIGVKPATTVLGEFQQAIAEIGAVIRDDVPARGPLPRAIVHDTELRFSPTVAAGSVIFSLRPVAEEEGLWPEEDAPSLLEQSLGRLFEVFDSVEKPASADSDPDQISTALRDFGPRTARHLFIFADALNREGLSLDLGWTRSGKPLTRSRLSTEGASFLGKLAKNATKRDTPVTLVGQITKLGTDNKHRFKDEERGLITISTSSDLTDQLHPTFRHDRVELEAVMTESVNAATGSSSRTYSAESLRVLD